MRLSKSARTSPSLASRVLVRTHDWYSGDFSDVFLALNGIGLRVLNEANVIIRNIKISKVLAPGDNIGIQAANHVWVDHVDLSSDRDHDKVLRPLCFYGATLTLVYRRTCKLMVFDIGFTALLTSTF